MPTNIPTSRLQRLYRSAHREPFFLEVFGEDCTVDRYESHDNPERLMKNFGIPHVIHKYRSNTSESSAARSSLVSSHNASVSINSCANKARNPSRLQRKKNQESSRSVRTIKQIYAAMLRLVRITTTLPLVRKLQHIKIHVSGDDLRKGWRDGRLTVSCSTRRRPLH